MSKRTSKKQQSTTITLSWFTVILGFAMSYLVVNISIDILENLGVTFFPEYGIWAIVVVKLIAIVVIFIAFLIIVVIAARRSEK